MQIFKIVLFKVWIFWPPFLVILIHNLVDESAFVVEVANFVLAGLEDGHVVVDDGVLGARRFQLQQDPGLFAARELALVDIVPAVTLVILKQTRFNLICKLKISNKIVQWLWLSWQSDHFRHQRSKVLNPSLAKFYV